MKWFESEEHCTIHCAKSREIAIKKKLNRYFMKDKHFFAKME